MNAATSELTVKEAREMLRGAGLRSTTSRVAVLQHVAVAGKPLSHSDVAEVLVPEGFDKSTIYRCLVELADANILTRLEVGDHSWRFELRRGDHHEAGQHPHFMCVDCGKVTCLNGVEVKIVKTKGGAKEPLLGEVTEIFLKGRCLECGKA
ncbi:ferric uptake regulator, Fur family [Pirellula staleyi DSM 6068]|uniref:Ferric uptake regulator, Fur family n=1 Tax=Pirellula staleyi (strain ATCC 27377 / DSM 6068 / ICPB 4128) TaxID=530564 RepID=D2R899_PIRSD|nr:transcriptional repressor [Pirellula staleyi]ADB15716.1 ferric uptake regulator, Fur family [Pirellula staleyi DSM 6068]